ncbi:hypothetical protein ACHAXS_012615 [Conticribra weissflogii]
MESSPSSSELRSSKRLSAVTRTSARSISPRGRGNNDISASASVHKSGSNGVKSAEDQNEITDNENVVCVWNKRRMGSLLGWDTRRQNNAMKEATSSEAKAERQNGPQVPTIVNRSSSKDCEIQSKERRRMGALTGWETRRKNAMKKGASSKSDSSMDAILTEEHFDGNTAGPSAKGREAESIERRRVGALTGWETRRRNSMKRATVSENSQDVRTENVAQVASKANAPRSNFKLPSVPPKLRANEEKKKRSIASLIGWETRRENARRKMKAAQDIGIEPIALISTENHYPNGGNKSSRVPPKHRAIKSKEKLRKTSLIGWEKQRENARKRAAASIAASAEDLKQCAASLAGGPISNDSTTCSDSALVSVTYPKSKNYEDMINSNKRGRYEVDECDAALFARSQNRESSLTTTQVTDSAHSSAYDKPEVYLEPDNLMTSSSLQQDNNDISDELLDKNPVSKKGSYNADARRQAALAGWEKRRLAKLRMQYKRASTAWSSDDTSAENNKVEKEPKKEKTAPQDYSDIDGMRAGRSSVSKSKTSGALQQRRSTRAFTRSCKEADESKDDIRAIATYLRVSRNWMEFHPSSRYGNGTATYAFIPASIAMLIRNGTIPQKHIVLKHGKIGVHFALDYEGIGGLRAMVEKYGKDYAPYPTDEMLECSRNEQEKRLLRASEWDLGEDMPWEAVGERIMEEVQDEMNQKLYVARIVDSSEENPHRSDSLSAAIEIKESTIQPLNGIIDKSETSDDLHYIGEILAALDTSVSKHESVPGDLAHRVEERDADSSCARLSGSMLQCNPLSTEEVTSISTPLKEPQNGQATHAFQSNCFGKKSGPIDDRVPKKSASLIFVPSPRSAEFKQWHFGLA